MCLPAISFTEVPPVHQLELVGGRTHHRSNSVCVRSFYDALPNASARVCACAVCVQCHAPHPRIRAHLYPATAAQASSRRSQSVQHPEPPNLGGGRLWGWQSPQHSARGSSPCVSGCARCGFCMAAVASPVSMLSAFACACKVAVGRCGHLLTVGPGGTGLCGQNSLIAFDQRCSKFLLGVLLC